MLTALWLAENIGNAATAIWNVAEHISITTVNFDGKIRERSTLSTAVTVTRWAYYAVKPKCRRQALGYGAA